MTFNQPLPDYETRDNNMLELLYLTKHVLILFYFLIKKHPFQNGNKRIADMTVLVF